MQTPVKSVCIEAKIVVHSASDPHSRTKRRQEVDIYYKGIGILEMSKVFATRENERNGIV